MPASLFWIPRGLRPYPSRSLGSARIFGLSGELPPQLLRSAQPPRHPDRLEGAAGRFEQRECAPAVTRSASPNLHPCLIEVDNGAQGRAPCSSRTWRAFANHSRASSKRSVSAPWQRRLRGVGASGFARFCASPAPSFPDTCRVRLVVAVAPDTTAESPIGDTEIRGC